MSILNIHLILNIIFFYLIVYLTESFSQLYVLFGILEVARSQRCRWLFICGLHNTTLHAAHCERQEGSGAIKDPFHFSSKLRSYIKPPSLCSSTKKLYILLQLFLSDGLYFVLLISVLTLIFAHYWNSVDVMQWTEKKKINKNFIS